jgi:hypothetical protein
MFITVDWDVYKNLMKGHYDSAALQSVQIKQAVDYARSKLPVGV